MNIKHVMYGKARYTSAKHPLYQVWKNIIEYHGETTWSSFEEFANEVGVQPARTKLKQLDPSRPFGPGNGHWRALR